MTARRKVSDFPVDSNGYAVLDTDTRVLVYWAGVNDRQLKKYLRTFPEELRDEVMEHYAFGALIEAEDR